MRYKLSNWKTNFLNIAGRTTLAISTLANIPNYIMQFTSLPNKIIQSIDRIIKNFIWGTTDSKKKLHLLNWDTVTRDRSNGGLGIRKARLKNKTLLATLAWRLLNYPQSPWANLLIAKYINNSLMSNSFIWKSLKICWDICSKGTVWTIGHNSSLDIWNTKWIPNCQPLCQLLIGPLNKTDLLITPKDLRNKNN